ncbi:MAG TPA: sigma-70 family RNA polymerase sigma factor [Candidatus Sulfotelmatobacter sp.]|nr:sigma-70 family RNA polymerase sigma factor [Candidatus Sulfotelmatobacter sp.]
MEFFSFDAAYLQKLREGDSRTEQHFVAYFSKLLLIKLRSRLRSSPAVEDLRQETFVRVLKALRAEGGIRSPEKLGSFVNSVCNNVLQEFYRASGPTVAGEEGTLDAADTSMDLDGMLDAEQVRKNVRQTLSRLPKKDQQLLRALFLEEKEKDEICRQFSVDRDYLRVLLHRAKQNFRVFYQKQGAAGGIQ